METIKVGNFYLLKDECEGYVAIKDINTNKITNLQGKSIIQTSGGQIIKNGNKLVIQSSGGQVIIKDDKIVTQGDINYEVADDFNDEISRAVRLAADCVNSYVSDTNKHKTTQTINRSYNCSIIDNVCKINGEKYVFPKGSNISVIGADIYVNGKKIDKEEYRRDRLSKALLDNNNETITPHVDAEDTPTTNAIKNDYIETKYKEDDNDDLNFVYDGHKLPYVPGRKICFAEDIIETKNAIYCYGYKLTPDGWKKSLVGKILQILRG